MLFVLFVLFFSGFIMLFSSKSSEMFLKDVLFARDFRHV